MEGRKKGPKLISILVFFSAYLHVLNLGSYAFVRRNRPLGVPRPFIIQTSLDVTPSKDGSDSSHIIPPHKVEKNKHLILNNNSNYWKKDKFYNFQKGGNEELISSVAINKASPKIKFYKMNCAVGHKCSAIIPGPKTPTPKPKSRTDEEMRTYLKNHGLENGFNYSKDDRVNRHNVVARYFRGDENLKRNARNAREQRKIRSFADYDDYWPGSEYRPGNKASSRNNQALSKIYKYKVRGTQDPNHKTDSYSTQKPSNYNDEYTYELPFPTFTQIPDTPRTIPYNRDSKGVWNRYSNSVISQFDKNKNDWVKISSTNTKLGSGFVNEGYNKIPQSGQGDLQTGVGLTVLGLPDVPHSFDQPTHKPNFKPFDSSSYSPLPPPDRPFPPINPPSTPTNSVSFPLDVLPPDLTDPVLVFSSDDSTKGVSYDSDIFNYTNYGFPSYINLTYPTTTTKAPTKVAVTKRPRPRPQTKRPKPKPRPQRPNLPRNPIIRAPNTTPSPQTQTSSPNTMSLGEGEGGGGGLIPNAYAIMAAVGAGLIPASIVAILPVLLGRRRRRKRRSFSGSPWDSSPSSFNPTTYTPLVPIAYLLEKNITISKQIAR